MTQTHTLKIWPAFYEPVLNGTKTFEFRENDRGFQKGDMVVLREFDPELDGATNLPKGYTEKPNLKFKIGYVLPVLGSNCVVLSINDLEEL